MKRSLVDVIAGPDASDRDRAFAAYKLDRMEFELFFGRAQPFPTFDEWVERRLAERPK